MTKFTNDFLVFTGITYSCKSDAIIGTSSLRLKIDDIFSKAQGKQVFYLRGLTFVSNLHSRDLPLPVSVDDTAFDNLRLHSWPPNHGYQIVAQ